MTPDFLKEIALKSIENAESLILDADLLSENGRVPRAYTLYQLAIEEVGKAIWSMVLSIHPDGLTDENIKHYHKNFFRRHSFVHESLLQDSCRPERQSSILQYQNLSAIKQ